jgi:hypothetical protein
MAGAGYSLLAAMVNDLRITLHDFPPFRRKIPQAKENRLNSEHCTAKAQRTQRKKTQSQGLSLRSLRLE